MNDLAQVLPDQIDPVKLELVEKVALKEEQLDCPVTHKFGPGIYIREVFLPAGAFVIGHHHNKEHLNVMLKGRIKFFGDDDWIEMEAPQTFVSPAGRKVAYVYEDTIWQNIYATEETDTEKLEEMILTKSMTWEEHKKYNDLQLTYDKSEDFDDYYVAIREMGFDHETVRKISLNEDDQIPFPYGSYNVEIAKSKIEGRGLFTTADIKEGDVIAPARLKGMRTPAGRYINHSKNPNSYFFMDSVGDVFVVANKNLKGYRGGNLGDEITVDYRQILSLGV